METVLSISCHCLSETPGTGYELENHHCRLYIYSYLLNRRSLCKDFNSCFELFVLLVRGWIKISNKELVSESALYIHKQTWKKERLKKKSKIKNIAETGINYYLSFRAFGWESLGNAKNVIKYIVPRPGIIQSSCQRALRIWTGDLQIFSLTLSQLSYLGNWRLLREKIILLLYTISPILSVVYCFNMYRREASLNFVSVEYVE